MIPRAFNFKSLVPLLVTILCILYVLTILKIRTYALLATTDLQTSSVWLSAWQSIGTMSAVFVGAITALASLFAVRVTQEQREVAARQADLMQQQLEASRDQNRAVQEQTSTTLKAIRQQVIAAAIELDPVVLIRNVNINYFDTSTENAILTVSFEIVNTGKTVAKRVEWTITYGYSGTTIDFYKPKSERSFELIPNETREFGDNLNMRDIVGAMERSGEATVTIDVRYYSSFMDPNQRNYASKSAHSYSIQIKSNKQVNRSTGFLVGHSGATSELLL